MRYAYRRWCSQALDNDEVRSIQEATHFESVRGSDRTSTSTQPIGTLWEGRYKATLVDTESLFSCLPLVAELRHSRLWFIGCADAQRQRRCLRFGQPRSLVH